MFCMCGLLAKAARSLHCAGRMVPWWHLGGRNRNIAEMMLAFLIKAALTECLRWKDGEQ